MTTVVTPSAEIVFDTLFAYQRSAALKAALDLDLFTAIDEGPTTTKALAGRCAASERGVRILCDYLTTIGLLTTLTSSYRVPPGPAPRLSQRSAANVHDGSRTLPGDASAVSFPDGFDAALVTNFVHHFVAATCTDFLKKVHAALKPAGRVAVLEFVPNQDRVSPPVPARFSLTMLSNPTSGDAYTFAELKHELEGAG